MRKRIWIPEAPNLIINPYRSIGEVQSNVGYNGRFTVELIHSRTKDVVRRLEFNNLVTDAGLNQIAYVEYVFNLFTHIGVGTGSTPPAVTNTDLEAPLARTNNNGGTGDVSGMISGNAYAYYRITRLFTESEANGNLTEVGVFNAATAGVMFCRQLLKDDAGAATTITKTSEYQLRITYELRAYPDPGPTVYSATINGVAGDVTRLPAHASHTNWMRSPAYAYGFLNAGVYTGALGTAYSAGGGTVYENTAQTSQAYTSGSLYRDVLFTWSGAAANATLTGFQDWSPMPRYKHQFPAGIAKTSVEKLEILRRNSWNRYTIP